MSREPGLRELFRDFGKLNIMVIGDVMIDSYLWGRVDRISPEAPIPVVSLKKRENRMGGAANVARNVKALGANPILCSVIGDDAKGETFRELLKSESIGEEGMITSHSRITTTKFRIFGNAFQMLRVDEEVDEPLDDSDHEAMTRNIAGILRDRKIDCIIFQDYDKGVITPGLISEVVGMAGRLGIPVTVDPKKRNFLNYRDVTLFKPNLKELRDGLNLAGELHDTPSVEKAALELRERVNCRYVLATLSEKGVLISYRENDREVSQLIPAHLRQISDVSGAGDTVITVASMCLALGRSPYEIAYISNLAGGLVCEEVGVVPVNKEKLLHETLALL